MTTLNRRRSWLFTPATKPDRFDQAASAGADVLTPSAEAVAEARRILEENAKGVGVVGGRMVDEAVARKARRILAAVGAAVSE